MTSMIAATKAGRIAALTLATHTDAQLAHAHTIALHYLHPTLTAFGARLKAVTPAGKPIPFTEAKGAAAGRVVASVQHHMSTFTSDAAAIIRHAQGTAHTAGGTMAASQLATYRLTVPQTPLPKMTPFATHWDVDAAQHAQRVIAHGVLLNRTPDTIVRDLDATLHYTLVQAQLTSRTITLAAFRQGALGAFRALACPGWLWYTNLGKACGMCTAMHGTRHGADETLDSHLNCGCMAIPLPPASLDLPDPDLESGSDWFADQPAAVQQQVLSPTKYQAYKAGDLHLSDLVGVSQSDTWGTSRYERSLKDLGINPSDYR